MSLGLDDPGGDKAEQVLGSAERGEPHQLAAVQGGETSQTREALCRKVQAVCVCAGGTGG